MRTFTVPEGHGELGENELFNLVTEFAALVEPGMLRCLGKLLAEARDRKLMQAGQKRSNLFREDGRIGGAIEVVAG